MYACILHFCVLDVRMYITGLSWAAEILKYYECFF